MGFPSRPREVSPTVVNTLDLQLFALPLQVGHHLLVSHLRRLSLAAVIRTALHLSPINDAFEDSVQRYRLEFGLAQRAGVLPLFGPAHDARLAEDLLAVLALHWVVDQDDANVAMKLLRVVALRCLGHLDTCFDSLVRCR